MSTEPGPPRLAIVGAGPAGLAAALAAASRGVRVTVVDAGRAAGGQFYRQPSAGLGARRPQALHHQWRTWQRLRDGLAREVAAGRVTHLPDHHVWCVERRSEGPGRFTVHALLGPDRERPVEVRADAVLLATGSYEKVLPFPGWTLPGVGHRRGRAGHAEGHARGVGSYGGRRRDRPFAAAGGDRARGGGSHGGRAGGVRRPQGPGTTGRGAGRPR